MKRFITVILAMVVGACQLVVLQPSVVRAQSTNLIANPSLETPAPSNASVPQYWLKGRWGTNTTKFTYPVAGQNGARGAKVEITKYTSGDAKWYFREVAVQPNQTYSFSDYYKGSVATELVAQVTTNLGSHVYLDMGSVAPSANWAQAAANVTMPANAAKVTVFHLINKVGSLQVDNFDLSQGSVPPVPAPLVVSLSAPTSGSTVNGTITVGAVANGGTGVAGVQFKLDGANLSSEDTTAPYSLSWDTTTVANGSHTLSAVVRDTSGATAAAADVAVTVNNSVASPPPPPTDSGLIPNSSLEQADASDPNLPQGWLEGSWGTNAASFSYLNSGHSGSRSVKVELTSYTSGDAKWYFTPQPVTPGQAYTFSDYYQSSIPSDIVLQITQTDGSVVYQYLGTAAASTGWTQFSSRFTAPATAKSLSVFHLIGAVGYLVTDDYSLTAYTPQPFNRGIVSLTFDDGWESQYTNALPLLEQYQMPATFYLISTYTGAPYYMTAAEINGLKAAGEELADHTATHPHLTTLDASQLTYELAGSQQQLQTAFGGSFQDFASPYGEYNDTVIAQVKLYFASHRSTDVGFNTRDSFDPYNIKVQNMDSTTTQAQVDSWVATAAQNKSWLVLVYHEIGSDIGGGIYHNSVAELQGHLQSIKNSGLAVETVQQALAEVKAQITP